MKTIPVRFLEDFNYPKATAPNVTAYKSGFEGAIPVSHARAAIKAEKAQEITPETPHEGGDA